MKSTPINAQHTQTDVLIAGAGPTGLMLALWLTRLGVRVRIVDLKDGPTVETRAIVVQARTLEFYDQLGLGEEARARGRHFDRVSLWQGSSLAGQVQLNGVAEDVTPHPYLYILTQDQNEALLVSALQARGVTVTWGSRLEDFSQDAAGVTAQLSHGSTTEPVRETVRAHYLAGCDGGKSLVRHSLKLGFTGGSSSGTFFVADTTATGKLRPDDLNLILERDRFFAVFPMLGRDRHRVVGSFSGDETLPPAEAFETVRSGLEARGVLRVETLHWFSTYRVHHRVAEHFRVGRVFLLGDAGHIHSPVGGQGMNTGLGDAVNLAWKLAQAVQGGDMVQADALLDTYERERMPFARALIQSTDRAFQIVSNTALWASFVRTQIAPFLLPLLTRPRPVRRELLLRVAQTRIHYPQSPLSSGRAGKVRGGDRLPWVKTEGGSNFAALKSLDWQLHVYGSAPADLERWCEIHALPLTTFPFNKQAQNAGFVQNALYLIRPDGYIGLVLPEFERERLEAYAERWLREPSPAARASRPPTPTD